MNYDYDPAADAVRPLTNSSLVLDTKTLGVPAASTCELITLDGEPRSLKIENGTVALPPLGLWSMVRLESRK